MLTWLVARRGTHLLAALYLTVAVVAFVLALSTWAIANAHHAASTTLELHITRYGG